MTTTPKSMTLEKVQDICLQWIAAVAGNGSMCAMAENRIKEVFTDLAKQREAEPAAWCPMNTAPRDGTVIVLRFGEDGESPGWFDSPCYPIKNDDGTWPDNPYGHPWAFIDKGSEIKHGEDVGSWFVNHARDTEYGPTHWRPYAHPQQRKASEEITLSEALNCLEDHVVAGHTMQGFDIQRMRAVTDRLTGQSNAVEVTPELFHEALIAWCEAGGLKTSIAFGSERLRAALQSALSAVASRDREWQTIESAPHNRKIIVSYINEYGNHRQVFATYYEAGTLQADDSLGDDECDEDGYAFPGWYEETETHDYVMPIPTPTHWMLPAKPPIDAARRENKP